MLCVLPRIGLVSTLSQHSPPPAAAWGCLWGSMLTVLTVLTAVLSGNPPCHSPSLPPEAPEKKTSREIKTLTVSLPVAMQTWVIFLAGALNNDILADRVVEQAACRLNLACRACLSGLVPLPEGGREQLSKEQELTHIQHRAGLLLLSLPLQGGAGTLVLWD